MSDQSGESPISFWHDERLIRLSIALLVSIITACIISLAIDKDHTGFLTRGDFPGFYAPAVILESGKASQLYDVDLQFQIENQYWPSFGEQFYMSVYPPYLAVLLRPLAKFDALTARHIFTLVSLLLFIPAVLLVAQFSHFFRSRRALAIALLLICYPVTAGVLGGQNSALSLFIVAASSAFMFSKKGANQKAAHLLSGMLLGLWLIKPQFGLLAGAMVLLSGYLWVFFGFMIVAAFLYLLGISVLGYAWPTLWLDAIFKFSSLNYVSNQKEQISIMGFSQGLASYFPHIVWLKMAVLALAVALSILLCALTIYQMYRARKIPGNLRRRVAMMDGFLLMGALIPLVSPQTLFYDLSISILAALRFINPKRDSSITLIFVLIILIGILTYFRDDMPVSFLTAFAVLNYAICYVALRQRAQGQLGLKAPPD